MSVIEQEGIVKVKDKDGNLYFLYPITKADLVDGLDELLAGKAAKVHAHDTATSSADGFMSAADKTYLSGMESKLALKADKKTLLELDTTTQHSSMSDYTSSGMYWINPGVTTDVPGGQWGFLRVFAYGNILQEFTGYSDSARAVRMFVNNEWTAWDLRQGGTWAPTVDGANIYTIRSGTWARIGNMVLLTWNCYGTFAGSTTKQITISGVPDSLTPTYTTSGGGTASGYYAPANTVFTGWRIGMNRLIYALGQTAGADGTRWESTAINQKASGDFSLSGCIAYQVN